jgi:hypothetical protein
MYQTRSAILFIIYNRPDLGLQVFEQIRKVKPPRLYVSADGPSPKRPNDLALCSEARNIVQLVDWDCEVKTLFRDENAGCKVAVSSAITWFFDQEEMGIILEDDCLPAISFFSFCDELLQKYQADTRISLISGCNLQHGRQHGNASYYFSNLTHVWGWASWRRVWQQYDGDVSGYNMEEINHQLRNIFDEPLVVESWGKIFTALQKNEIDTWDYQFALINFLNNRISVIPNKNLIKNIGFRLDATHTGNAAGKNANLPLHELDNICHPEFSTPEKNADNYTLYGDFDIYTKKRKNNSLLKRIKQILGFL